MLCVATFVEILYPKRNQKFVRPQFVIYHQKDWTFSGNKQNRKKEV